MNAIRPFVAAAAGAAHASAHPAATIAALTRIGAQGSS